MVRMGKTPKGWSTRAKKIKQDKRYSKYEKDPKKSSSVFQVGRVHPNLVSSYYKVLLMDTASKSAERHADHLIYYEYQEAKSMEESSSSSPPPPKTEEVEMDIHGETTYNTLINDDKNETKLNVEDLIDFSAIDPNYNSKYHVFTTKTNIDELYTQVILPTSLDFSSLSNRYKACANVVKLERLLDEKYGKYARPFMTHPKIEPYVKLVQRKFATGQLTLHLTRQNDPPLGKTTSIILLFMMYRNGVRRDGVALAALYLLVGLQPWVLLLLVAFGVDQMERRKRKPIPGMDRASSTIPNVTSYYHDDPDHRNDFLNTPVGIPLPETPTSTSTITPASMEDLGENQVKEKNNVLPPTTSLSSSSLDQTYHTIVLGTGPSALYCAAILSRAGRKVLLLSPSADVSGDMTWKDHNATNLLYHTTLKQTKKKTVPLEGIPFTISDYKIAHIERSQNLLAPALATDQDGQGGIRFATIGSEADGYAHDIFSISGMGGSNNTATTNTGEDDDGVGEDGTTIGNNNKYYANDTVPYVVRAGGVAALAEDSATFLGDGWQLNPDDISSSSLATYATTINDLNKYAGIYYLSKVTDPKLSDWWDSKAKPHKNEYRLAAVRNASDFLSHYIPLNPHVRSLCAGMGMCIEDLPPSQCSMAPHITSISAIASGEGYAFPVGGMRALGKAFENVIVKNGGKVFRNVLVEELVFDEEEDGIEADTKKKVRAAERESERKKRKDKKKTNNDDEVKKKNDVIGPKCIGVKLADGTIIRTTSLQTDSSTDIPGSIISTHGFLDTFLRLMPENIREKGGVPAGLAALKERRPQIKLLLLLDGNREKLNLPSADWWRLPNASLATDQVDPETNQIKVGEVGEMSSASQNTNIGKKFTSGSSWMRISFPSTKDPSWHERYGDVSTCVVTIEADDDFVRMFDTKPRIYSAPRSNEDAAKRLVERIMKDVRQEFPQLEKNILKLSLRGPIRMGLSHTPERYAAKGIRPITNYPNLFIAGSDLTVDTFSGTIVGSWLTTNAVLGYNYLDLSMLGKTTSSDLRQFLEEPSGDGEEAVLYTKQETDMGEDIEENMDQPMNDTNEENVDLQKKDESETDVVVAEPSKEAL